MAKHRSAEERRRQRRRQHQQVAAERRRARQDQRRQVVDSVHQQLQALAEQIADPAVPPGAVGEAVRTMLADQYCSLVLKRPMLAYGQGFDLLDDLLEDEADNPLDDEADDPLDDRAEGQPDDPLDARAASTEPVVAEEGAAGRGAGGAGLPCESPGAVAVPRTEETRSVTLLPVMARARQVIEAVGAVATEDRRAAWLVAGMWSRLRDLQAAERWIAQTLDAAPGAAEEDPVPLLAQIRLQVGRFADALDLLRDRCAEAPWRDDLQALQAIALMVVHDRRIDEDDEERREPCWCGSGSSIEACCGPRERAALDRFVDRTQLVRLERAMAQWCADHAEIAAWQERWVAEWFDTIRRFADLGSTEPIGADVTIVAYPDATEPPSAEGSRVVPGPGLMPDPPSTETVPAAYLELALQRTWTLNPEEDLDDQAVKCDDAADTDDSPGTHTAAGIDPSIDDDSPGSHTAAGIDPSIDDDDSHSVIARFADDPSIPPDLADLARRWLDTLSVGLWRWDWIPAPGANSGPRAWSDDAATAGTRAIVDDAPISDRTRVPDDMPASDDRWVPGPGAWLTDLVTRQRRYVAAPLDQLSALPRWSVLFGALVCLDGVWRMAGSMVVLDPSQGDRAAATVWEMAEAVAYALAHERGIPVPKRRRQRENPLPASVLADFEKPMDPAGSSLMGKVAGVAMAQLLGLVDDDQRRVPSSARTAWLQRSGSDEEHEEVVRQWCEQWVEHRLPQLDGLSPRQAAERPEARIRLEGLLRQFDHQEDLDRAAGRRTLDARALREVLGMVDEDVDDEDDPFPAGASSR